MRRSSMEKASENARSISSGVPFTAAGSGIPQCAVTVSYTHLDRVIQDPPDSIIEGEKVSPVNPANQANVGGK